MARRAAVGARRASGVGRARAGRGPGAGGADGRARRGGRTAGGESSVDGRRGITDTVGRSGDLGLVWHGANGTQRLGRLSIGLDLTGGIGVDAGEVLVITFAGLESTVLGAIWGVIGASDTIENMLAEISSVGARRVANFEAETVTAHEVVPLDDLRITVVVAVRPSGGVDETAEGVTTEISTVWVELSSKVISLEVDEGLVNKTDDLDVVWRLHKLNTPKGTSGDETRAMTRLGAPRDFLLFRLTDGSGTGRGCPEAEIVDRVKNGSLAEGLLVFGR